MRGVVFLAITALASVLCHGVELVTVKVHQGWLEGERRPLSTGQGEVYSFKGIPYAEPPVGHLRFKDPKPGKAWQGTRNATNHGAICIQFDIFTEQFLPGSEDCLFLNVYTPTLTPTIKPLSVLVFIHGGGWKSGSGNEEEHGADFLVEHDVIVVTINYRLDALGFLGMDSVDVPGNAGMKDQVLALRWVRDNIQFFGGNPAEVTIMGHSAGGASVIYHLISSMSKGLFKRAISLSGVPFCDWAQPFEPRRRAFSLGKTLGLNTNDATELLNFLQSVPVNDLLNTSPPVISQEALWINPLLMFPFVPVAEKNFGQERFLVETAKESIMNRNIRDQDLIIGYTSEEYIIVIPRLEVFIESLNLNLDLLVPIEVAREVSPQQVVQISDQIRKHYFGDNLISNGTMQEVLSFFNDHLYVKSVNRFLKYMPNRLSSKYLYKFYSLSSRNQFAEFGTPYGIRGVGHTEDLRYFFDAKSVTVPVDIHSEEYRLIKETCTLFTNFVKYGNPTPDDSLGIRWPKYDNNRRSFMAINNTLSIGTRLDQDVIDFWYSIYQSNGIALP